MADASAAAPGSIAAGQPSAARGEHHVPESEEADDAGEDDDRTTNVVIEGPGSCGEDRSPDEDGDHDPAKDLLGRGGWGRRCHEPTIGPYPAAADAAPPTAQKKGPRNGPDPRGAGNLNRFRERLDGACVAGALSRGERVSRRPCFQPLVNLKAGRKVGERFSGVKASSIEDTKNPHHPGNPVKSRDFAGVTQPARRSDDKAARSGGKGYALAMPTFEPIPPPQAPTG